MSSSETRFRQARRFVFFRPRRPALRSPLFPYTTLFRSGPPGVPVLPLADPVEPGPGPGLARSEEHTSELQSRGHLVCRLLLEKKKSSSSASSARPTLPPTSSNPSLSHATT